MLIADWIAIGLIALFLILGLIIGFGKGLRFFTKGFFGFIISILVCYFLGGLIIKLSFVDGLLGSFRALYENKEGVFYKILSVIRVDIIVYYVALFIIVQIIRIIIVSIISRVFEIQNVVIKIINKIFGAVLFVAFFALLVIIAFQIISMIGGDTEISFVSKIAGSKLKIDWIYENNPLVDIIELLFKIEIRIPVQVPATV